MPINVPHQIDASFRQHIESKYSPIPKDEQEKLIDGLVGLMEYGRDRRQSLHSFLEQVSRLIFRFFAIDEIAIGLYDRKQKDYHVDAAFGFRSEIAAEYLKVRYDPDDMVSQAKFPFVNIGKLSEFGPVEGLPESEKKFLNRPFMGTVSRKSLDEFHEGDYIDIWMKDPQKNIIGWIELARSRDGKLPPRMNIMWMELVASICACVIRQRWMHEDTSKGVRSNGN